MSVPPATELLALAQQAARAAGRELLARRGSVSGLARKSSATDPVSDADRASERLLVEMIMAARPDDGLLGEEGASREGSSGLRWVLDPLDGTVNWLYGFPAWCVSVAVEDERDAPGQALAGVVYDPLRDELFAATRDGGAWRQLGQSAPSALRVNDPVPLERALIATGFAYDPEDRRRQAQTVARLLPVARDIRRGGAAALDLCWLAAGRVDGYYEDTTSRWDWAAAALIAREAGAVVSAMGGGLVASGPALHDPLTALVGAY